MGNPVRNFSRAETSVWFTWIFAQSGSIQIPPIGIRIQITVYFEWISVILLVIMYMSLIIYVILVYLKYCHGIVKRQL